MVKAIMKSKTEANPNFEKDYQEYLKMIAKEEKAKTQAEYQKKVEEEK